MNRPTTKFDDLPNDGFVRLPTVANLFACSRATVWRRVKERLLPPPIKLGERISAWKVGDLRAILKSFASSDGEAVRTLVKQLEQGRTK